MCKQAIDNVIAAKELLNEALNVAFHEASKKRQEFGPGNKYGNVCTSIRAACTHLETVDMFIREAQRNNR